ncbi:UDP-N-acetylmuramoyl-tripeptide--D-alanyl-D-alanine ligase [Clostridia bacterium]|nr:UDP-N-acetylmuramoyl-tripeptide--D-alanyl-D-alanine ligase [Clostridia bacterium]
MEKINLKQLVNTLGITVNGFIPDDMFIEKIVTDTRENVSGGLFVALKGENFDGHDFVGEAINKGAKAILVSEDFNFSNSPALSSSAEIIVLKAKNMLKVLMQIVSFYRSFWGGLVIGVTGSVGKTSTKELIATVLEQKYNVFKTQQNLNNEIGVFKSMLSLKKEHEVAVIEMAMCALGEIEMLSIGAKPDVAVITNIGVVHLEFLKTRENILKAKMEITAGIKKGGLLVLNGDDEYLSKVCPNTNYKVLFCGINRHDLDIYAKNISQEGIIGTNFEINFASTSEKIKSYIPVAGKHHVLNALMACAVAKKLGLSNEQIKEGLANYKPVGARQKVITKNDITYVLDYYNANPDSVAAAIDVLSNLEQVSKKIFVFGDMGELGDASRQEHEKVGKLAAQKGISIFCVGEASKSAYEKAKSLEAAEALWFKNKKKLAKELQTVLTKGTAVWIKGSRFMKMEEVAELLGLLKED